MAVTALLAEQKENTVWHRLTRGAVFEQHDPSWPVVAGSDWQKRVMALEATDDFHAKQGRSTARVVLERAGKTISVYLKRHQRLGWFRGLLATLWPQAGWSPATREAGNLDWARGIGLDVPDTLAAGEIIGPWFRLQSFLVTRELTGMIGLHEAIPLAAARLSPAKFRRWKARLILELARITRRLHDARRFHKDLYLCHFYIRRTDTERVPPWPGRVCLIDFHRLRRHAWTWRYWQIKDLSQLLFSSQMKELDDRDRLLFLRLYAGSRKQADGLVRWLRLKAGRYHRHNERRAAA